MIYLPLISILFLIGPALAAISMTRSLTTRGHLGLLGLCILYGIFPFLVAWGGMGLAERFSWGEGSEAATARKVAQKSLIQQGFQAIVRDHVHSFPSQQNSIGTTD